MSLLAQRLNAIGQQVEAVGQEVAAEEDEKEVAELRDLFAGARDSPVPVGVYVKFMSSQENRIKANAARQERRSVLESAFPPGLYLTMACLMASLLYCFLLRADTISGSRSATLAGFPAETPVRALFVFMTTSFYAILQILADLDDPYSGAFRVDTSVVTARGTASGAPSRSATSPRPSRRTSRPSTIGPTCASTTPWRTPRSGGKRTVLIRRAAPRRASSGRRARTRPTRPGGSRWAGRT